MTGLYCCISLHGGRGFFLRLLPLANSKKCLLEQSLYNHNTFLQTGDRDVIMEGTTPISTEQSAEESTTTSTSQDANVAALTMNYRPTGLLTHTFGSRKSRPFSQPGG